MDVIVINIVTVNRISSSAGTTGQHASWPTPESETTKSYLQKNGSLGNVLSRVTCPIVSAERLSFFAYTPYVTIPFLCIQGFYIFIKRFTPAGRKTYDLKRVRIPTAIFSLILFRFNMNIFFSIYWAIR